MVGQIVIQLLLVLLISYPHRRGVGQLHLGIPVNGVEAVEAVIELGFGPAKGIRGDGPFHSAIDVLHPRRPPVRRPLQIAVIVRPGIQVGLAVGSLISAKAGGPVKLPLGVGLLHRRRGKLRIPVLFAVIPGPGNQMTLPVGPDKGAVGQDVSGLVSQFPRRLRAVIPGYGGLDGFPLPPQAPGKGMQALAFQGLGLAFQGAGQRVRFRRREPVGRRRRNLRTELLDEIVVRRHGRLSGPVHFPISDFPLAPGIQRPQRGIDALGIAAAPQIIHLVVAAVPIHSRPELLAIDRPRPARQGIVGGKQLGPGRLVGGRGSPGGQDVLPRRIQRGQGRLHPHPLDIDILEPAFPPTLALIVAHPLIDQGAIFFPLGVVFPPIAVAIAVQGLGHLPLEDVQGGFALMLLGHRGV